MEETLCLARLGVKWVRFSPIQFMMDVSLHENRYVVHILDTPRVTKSHPHSWNVVQLVERLTVNQVVAGSNPAISAKSVVHSMSCLWMKTRCTRSTDFNALSPSGKAQDFDSCIHWFKSSKGSYRNVVQFGQSAYSCVGKDYIIKLKWSSICLLNKVLQVQILLW